MAIIKFLYNNLADSSDTTLTSSSEDSDYPDTNIQHRWHTHCWHSSGNFVIDADNKYIDFNEGGSEVTSTLTEDTYTPADLATEIETQLNSDGTATFTCTYSTTTYKFTITSDGDAYVISDSNKYIDYNEGGASSSVTLTTGTYTASDLASEVQTKLDADAIATVTCSYASGTDKFTITSNGDAYVISDSNKYIDYNEGGASSSVTLTTGTYTADDLATEVQAKLDASATANVTCSYASGTDKFTIDSDGVTFELEWKTGTHGSDNSDDHAGTIMGYSDAADDTGATSYVSDDAIGDGTFELEWKTGTHGSDNTDDHIGTLMGYDDSADDTGAISYVSDDAIGDGTFEILWKTGTHGADGTDTHVGTDTGYDDSADDTGALTYTSDDVTLHTEEWLKFDLGSAQTVKTVVIKNHNIGTAGSTLKLQGHTADAWADPDVNESITVTADQVLHLDTTGWSKRYWRILIEDTDNSDGYIYIGRVFLGSYFQPTHDYRVRTLAYIDPSTKKYSTGGQVSTNPKTHYKTISYEFPVVTSTDLGSFETIFDDVGVSENYFIVEDSADTTPKDCTYYVQNADDWSFKTKEPGQDDEDFTVTVETLR